jgi:site-specific DNA recombinase
MYVPSNNPKYTCNKCRNKIPIDDLEAVFHEQVKNFLISDQEIASHLEQANDIVKEKAELLAVLEKEAGKLAQEINKLYDLYQSNMIDKIGFGTKYKPLAERRDQLENQIPERQAEIDILKISHLSQEVAIDEARDVHSQWPTLSPDEKRRIAEAIVEKIVVGDGEVEITLYYTPPPPNANSQNHGNLATNPQGFIAASN